MELPKFTQIELTDIERVPSAIKDNTESFKSVEINGPFEDEPRWIGNCLSFYYVNYNPSFTLGPNWLCYLITNATIITLACLFLVSIISKVTVLGTLAGVFALLIQVASYMLAALKNPGIPDRSLSKFGNAKKLNKQYMSLITK